jgi:hypothetical protein
MPVASLPPCRTLGEYVTELVERLGRGEPPLLERLCQVVGPRRARITLDQESVDVWFDGARLRVEPDADAPVDGAGSTDRQTTLDLLDGYCEVSDAILAGRLRATGEVENLIRMFQAIEILLDGATRIPALQEIARDYQVDPCRSRSALRAPAPALGARGVVVDPDSFPAHERALLARLGLLP